MDRETTEITLSQQSDCAILSVPLDTNGLSDTQ